VYQAITLLQSTYFETYMKIITLHGINIITVIMVLNKPKLHVI